MRTTCIVPTQKLKIEPITVAQGVVPKKRSTRTPHTVGTTKLNAIGVIRDTHIMPKAMGLRGSGACKGFSFVPASLDCSQTRPSTPDGRLDTNKLGELAGFATTNPWGLSF